MNNQISRIMRLPEVMNTTGLGRSSIYAYVQKNVFPKPFKIGEKAIGWKADEVAAYIERRAELRGAK